MAKSKKNVWTFPVTVAALRQAELHLPKQEAVRKLLYYSLRCVTCPAALSE